MILTLFSQCGLGRCLPCCSPAMLSLLEKTIAEAYINTPIPYQKLQILFNVARMDTVVCPIFYLFIFFSPGFGRLS